MTVNCSTNPIAGHLYKIWQVILSYLWSSIVSCSCLKSIKSRKCSHLTRINWEIDLKCLAVKFKKGQPLTILGSPSSRRGSAITRRGSTTTTRGKVSTASRSVTIFRSFFWRKICYFILRISSSYSKIYIDFYSNIRKGCVV